jgi:hypothetical protein
VRQIRTLRAKWRELETGLRRLLGGHEGGNPGYRQGGSSGLPRQFSTLPGYVCESSELALLGELPFPAGKEAFLLLGQLLLG